MSDRVFVYGSLLQGVPNSRNSLLQPAELVGPATLQAKLFSLGGYPGAVLSDSREDLVLGEVYRLLEPEASLRRMDRYEGFVPESPEGCEFIRQQVTVWRTADVPGAGQGRGLDETVWVYTYALPVHGLPPIPGGDYRAFSAR